MNPPKVRNSGIGSSIEQERVSKLLTYLMSIGPTYSKAFRIFLAVYASLVEFLMVRARSFHQLGKSEVMDARRAQGWGRLTDLVEK